MVRIQVWQHIEIKERDKIQFMEGGLHRHAKRRTPEEVSKNAARVEESPQDEHIANQFGARKNRIGKPHSAGSGTEKLAYRSNDPERIILVHKREFNPRTRKSLDLDLTVTEDRKKFIRKGILKNIINILLPGSVSDTKHIASSFGVTIDRKIEGETVATANEVISRTMFKLRMRQLGLDIDSGAHNFISRGSGGPLAYIDSVYEKKSPARIANLVEKAIQRAGLQESDRTKALSLISRYKKLS